MYYGLIKTSHARDYARDVCMAISPRNHVVATKLLLETAAQETNIGLYRDPTPYRAGSGLCQHDLLPFIDIKNRTRHKFKKIILDKFGIDINIVEWRELENSPLLSFIFCRLFYILKRPPIPSTRSGRAAYWKRHYNTRLGRGTTSEYMSNARKFIPLTRGIL